MSLSKDYPEWGSVWTPLLQAAIRGGTDYNYRLGIKHFLDWIDFEYRAPLRTAREIDEALCEYGWWVYENMGGRGKWRLNMAVFGVEHYLPQLEKQMKLARRSLKGWTNLRPPVSHSPLNFSLVSLIAMELDRMGHPGAAVAALIGFDCYLRISEIGGLRVCEVSDIKDSDLHLGRQVARGGRGTTTLLSIPVSKTWSNQSVQVRRPVLAGLLWSWIQYVTDVREQGSQALLFPDPGTFRRLFYEAQVNLGWAKENGAVPFVPHSLRHGGAACDYLTRGALRLEEILFRGRWASVKSTRTYIQTGPALMAAAAAGIPRWQREMGHRVAQSIRFWITIPNYL